MDVEPSPRARLRALLEPFLAGDPGGRGWLPGLLGAAPFADRLGDALTDPGYLHPNITVAGLEGRRTCFMYPVAPPHALVSWFIDHPEHLTWPMVPTWPDGAELSPQAQLLRRALVHDEPPGARAKAQERAHDLMPKRSAFAQEWWRFEETHEPDCLLTSDSCVIVFLAGDPHEPATPWYPQRTRLHRALESACRLAEARPWGVLAIGAPEATEPDSADAIPAAPLLGDTLIEGAPHLDDLSRLELADGYLGALGWDAASAALP